MKGRRFRRKIKVEDAADEQQSDSDLEQTSDEEQVEEDTDVSTEADEQDSAVQAEELAALREENQGNYDKYLRAVAELENFKKRAQKERSDLIRYAGESLARELLEVVDNLELALKQREAEGQTNEFFKGIELIHNQFVSTLERFSIRPESAVGEAFDPEKHEAMASVPSPDHSAGTIIEEFKKAYFFKDKLLRPGQVVVATEQESASEAAGEEDNASEDE